MRVMRLTQINQGQHHENERLKCDHKNVKQSPDSTCNDVSNEEQTTAEGRGRISTQQGDQHEDEFASEHVTEQPHAMRHGFGDELNDLENKVDWPQYRVGTKRSSGQLVQPSTHALDFDVVKQAHQQNGS